jgi:hypothetical protein
MPFPHKKPAAKSATATAAPAAKKPPVAAPAKRGFPARKTGTAAKRPARKPLPTWKVPVDFKPHFLLVTFRTEADGLIGSRFKAVRYVGRFAEDADDKKKFDIMSYDPQTLAAIQGRMSSTMFKASNDKKFSAAPKARAGEKGGMRLPAKTVFSALIRVGKKTAEGTLTARIPAVFQHIKNEKTGKVRMTPLEKTDPAYRLIRRASRILPGAFDQCLMPPKRTRTRSSDADEE